MPIGRIAGPFGVRGEAKLDLLTDFPERFDTLERLYLGSERREYLVERSRKHKHQIVLKLEGVDTPEEVDRLRGQEAQIPRSEAVDLPPDHYFLEELIGFRVETEGGKVLGTIGEVLRTGSNDVYVVGSGTLEILIPGTKEAVRELDLKGRRLVVEPWVLEAEE